MLGRLELGEVEESTYFDPYTKEQVTVSFRHPSAGELARSFRKAGIKQKDGRLLADDELELVDKIDEASIYLAKMCLISPSHEKVWDRALAVIGKYLHEQSQVGEDEGEQSGPDAIGPTSAPSEKG